MSQIDTYIGVNYNYAPHDYDPHASAQSNTDAAIDHCIQRCGEQHVADCCVNAWLEGTAGALKEIVAGNPNLPEGVKDEITEKLDQVMADHSIDTQPEARDALMEVLQMIREAAAKEMKEDSDEIANKSNGGGGASEGSGNSGNASDSWLVKLAKALGSMAGDHLKKAIQAQEKISQINKGEVPDGMSLDPKSDNKTKGSTADGGTSGPDNDSKGEKGMSDADKAGLMAEVQAEMQAHMQMFKLLQEGMTTVLKSTGEALSSTARKQ